jgi:cob(I)alamin adenosyltransferase
MSDPTLKKTSVKISYASSDGHRMTFTANGGKGTTHQRTGEEVPPQSAFIEAVAQLARLTALFGYQDEALAAFTKAQKDIADWKEARVKS